MRTLRAHHSTHYGRGAGHRRIGVLPERSYPPLISPFIKREYTLGPERDDGFRSLALRVYIIEAPGALGAEFTVNCRSKVMRGEPGVVDYLNKALRHELTAVNQYWLHYRLLDNWGYKSLAKQWRKESIEEMQHADKLIERIIFLESLPNMQVLDPLHIGQNVKEVLDYDLAAEMSARALYEEAATHCHSVRDYVSRDLFEKLMHDEEEHIDFLETQLDLVAKLGLELYAQHHIGELHEDED